MTLYVCPIDSDGESCWTGLSEVPEAESDVNIIDWLKAEMLDGLNHACAHEVDGPMLLGYDENGKPNFEVFRPTPSSWGVRPVSVEKSNPE